MAVLNARAEQFGEPVGIPQFGFPEVGDSARFRILDDIFACGGVIGVHQLGHLVVNSAVGRIDAARKVEPALLVHFLIDGHLLLRVHNVEFRIGRHEAYAVFAVVADLGHSRGAFLGGYDYDSGHCPGSVDGSCGTVFENLEGLDVVGVESGDCGTDKCCCITRGKGISIHIHHVFHYHSVNNPERFGVAVDRSGTPHSDFGCGSEGSGDILH